MLVAPNQDTGMNELQTLFIQLSKNQFSQELTKEPTLVQMMDMVHNDTLDILYKAKGPKSDEEAELGLVIDEMIPHLRVITKEVKPQREEVFHLAGAVSCFLEVERIAVKVTSELGNDLDSIAKMMLVGERLEYIKRRFSALAKA